MRESTPNEEKEYDALLRGVAKVVGEVDPHHVVFVTVLTKVLLIEMVKMYGMEDGVKRLSKGINEALADMREFGIK